MISVRIRKIVSRSSSQSENVCLLNCRSLFEVRNWILVDLKLTITSVVTILTISVAEN